MLKSDDTAERDIRERRYVKERGSLFTLLCVPAYL